MDYHALYMTCYRRITCHFITPIDDVGPMRYQTTVFICQFIGLYYFNIIYILHIIFILTNNYISFYVID